MNYVKNDNDDVSAHWYTTVYRDGQWYMIDDREDLMSDQEVRTEINEFSILLCYIRANV